MSDISVRQRWLTPPGRKLAAEVVDRLVAGVPLDGLGLGVHGERVDLRGLPASAPRVIRGIASNDFFVCQLGDLLEFRERQLQRLDLSEANLSSIRFHGSDVRDCVFDHAQCRDWRLWETHVAGCTFVKADLRESSLGTWRHGTRSMWSGVDFSGADLRQAFAQAAVFESCVFTASKLKGFQFNQCELVGTRFAGVLSEVLFDGRPLGDVPAPPPMIDVDFADAVLTEVEFRGWTELSGAALPADEDVRVISRYRCVLEHAMTILGQDESLPARRLKAVFANHIRMMRTSEEANVLNRRDYLTRGGEELLALADAVFSRAEQECREK